MAGIDIISDSTGKEIVAAIQSTDVAQARILEINTAAEAKKNEVLESIPEDYSNISKEVDELKSDLVKNLNADFGLSKNGVYVFEPNWIIGGINSDGTDKESTGSNFRTDYYERSIFDESYIHNNGISTVYMYRYSETKTMVSVMSIPSGKTQRIANWSNTKYLRFTTNADTYKNISLHLKKNIALLSDVEIEVEPVVGTRITFDINSDNSAITVKSSATGTNCLKIYGNEMSTLVRTDSLSFPYIVPNNSFLVFMMDNKTISVLDESSYVALVKPHKTLLFNHYGDVKGYWRKYYTENIIDDNSKSIDDVKRDMPLYYEQYMYEKVKSFNDLTEPILHNDSFVFITDIHTGSGSNSDNSGKLINYLGKNTKINKLFCGGDLVPATGSKNVLLNGARIATRNLHMATTFMDFCCVRGNHDLTIKTDASMESGALNTGVTMPFANAFNIIMGYVSDKVVRTTDRMYYYFDDKNSNVRYVFVDTSDGDGATSYDTETTKSYDTKTGCSTEQMNWLKNVLSSIDDGWHVVIIGHIPVVNMDSGANDIVNVSQIIKDYSNKRNDFNNAKGTFVAYISGHTHKDKSIVSDNTLFITTACDARFADDGIARTNGTTAEQLFDVFTIDKDNRKLYTTRIGAGSNRNWNY